jgi:hypothetical protein
LDSTQQPNSGAQERKQKAQVQLSTVSFWKGNEAALVMQHMYDTPLKQASGVLRPRAQQPRPTLQYSLLSSFVIIPTPRDSSPTARQHSSTQQRQSCLLATPNLQSPQLYPVQQQIKASDTQVLGILIVWQLATEFEYLSRFIVIYSFCLKNKFK